jgi:hypothetical protein
LPQTLPTRECCALSPLPRAILTRIERGRNLLVWWVFSAPPLLGGSGLDSSIVDAALKRRSSTAISTIESAFQEVPGFLVFGVFAVFAVGGEDDVELVVGGFEGEDVPSVGGDDPSTSLRTGSGGDEVDLVGAVGDVVGGESADVGVVAFADGAFDLDAAEAAAVVPSVAIALSGQAKARS